MNSTLHAGSPKSANIAHSLGKKGVRCLKIDYFASKPVKTIAIYLIFKICNLRQNIFIECSRFCSGYIINGSIRQIAVLVIMEKFDGFIKYYQS